MSGESDDSSDANDDADPAIVQIPSPPASSALTPAELVERLRLNSPALVDEVYALCWRALQDEESRKSAVEAKASSLLQSVGLTLTLITALGAAYGQPHVGSLGPVGPFLFVGAFGFAIGCCLWAAHLALRAVRITDEYRGIDGNDVFGSGVLRTADSLDSEELNSKAPAAYYKRFVAVHVWQIYRKHFDIHETKAMLVKRAQAKFIFALYGIGLVAALLVAGIVAKQLSTPAIVDSASKVPASMATPQIVRPTVAENGASDMSNAPAPTQTPAPTSAPGSSQPAPTPIPGGGEPVHKQEKPSATPVPGSGRVRHDGGNK